MSQVLALVDCSNFYVSVERVFRADLQGRPVIVLSNNDGCVVAASQEAKALGITRGAPIFQYRELIEQHQITLFSSNFPLYQSISDRIVRVLARFAFNERIESYSIDESFLDLSHIAPDELPAYGRRIRETIQQYIGIPVRVGIAPTKVLCKVALEQAKRHKEHEDVVSLVGSSDEALDALLETISVGDVWGIGPRSERVLHRKGIFTARALRAAEPRWIRRRLRVVGERIVYELRGLPCLPLELVTKPRKHLLSSQSFGRQVESLEELHEAVAHYTARAAEKLRAQGSTAGHISIFIHTNYFDADASQYASSSGRHLLFPSAFTPELIAIAQDLASEIYRAGYAYKKAGVLLSAIRPREIVQPDLFGVYSFAERARQQRLMQVIDEINRRYGRNTVFFCAQGLERPWQSKQQRRSRRYTTQWHEILSVVQGEVPVTP